MNPHKIVLVLATFCSIDMDQVWTRI